MKINHVDQKVEKGTAVVGVQGNVTVNDTAGQDQSKAKH
jgi:hypothetical protein